MTTKIFGPRKRRTRQHVIADQSVHYVQGLILDAGHTAERFNHDYGYDLQMFTYDGQGYPESGSVFFQVKATDHPRVIGGDSVCDVDVRDFHLWMSEQTPVILILYDAIAKSALWLHVQHYFRDDLSRRPKKGAKTVRVRVSERQELSLNAIARIRTLKNTAIA